MLGVEIYDHYGQTEAGMLINNHHHPALCQPIRPGCMGRAMPGWKAAILKMDADEIAPSGEPGRLAFDLRESPLAWFRGYAGEPEKSAEQFSPDERWYLGGHIESAAGAGSFYFASRDHHVKIMAGYRIITL